MIFGADADVYAADRRGLGPFISLLWDEDVTTTYSRGTAALFLSPPVHDTT